MTSAKGSQIQVVSVTVKVAELLARVKAQTNGTDNNFPYSSFVSMNIGLIRLPRLRHIRFLHAIAAQARHEQSYQVTFYRV
jgi:hypothetical protein